MHLRPPMFVMIFLFILRMLIAKIFVRQVSAVPQRPFVSNSEVPANAPQLANPVAHGSTATTYQGVISNGSVPLNAPLQGFTTAQPTVPLPQGPIAIPFNTPFGPQLWPSNGYGIPVPYGYGIPGYPYYSGQHMPLYGDRPRSRRRSRSRSPHKSSRDRSRRRSRSRSRHRERETVNRQSTYRSRDGRSVDHIRPAHPQSRDIARPQDRSDVRRMERPPVNHQSPSLDDSPATPVDMPPPRGRSRTPRVVHSPSHSVGPASPIKPVRPINPGYTKAHANHEKSGKSGKPQPQRQTHMGISTTTGVPNGKRIRSPSSTESEDASDQSGNLPNELDDASAQTAGFHKKTEVIHYVDDVEVQAELARTGLLVDPWIDGDYTRIFRPEHLDEASRRKTTFNAFSMHWAFRNGGGLHSKGSRASKTLAGAKEVKRQCLGILRCPNWNREENPCKLIVRPKTRRERFKTQLVEVCPMEECKKADLEHVGCDVYQEMQVWEKGVKFSNFGYHCHERPTVVLHLTPVERNITRAVMEANPKLGPSALRSGRPDMVGPTVNVRSISSALGNRGRIAYEKKLLKESGTKGAGPFEQVVEKLRIIKESYPNIIRESSLGPGPVYLSIQSAFMAQLALTVDLDYTKPNNGLITDAAMKYFKSGMFMVIVTSGFATKMLKWAPVMITVAVGQDASVYERHFYRLFVSIYERCMELKIEFSNEMIIMV